MAEKKLKGITSLPLQRRLTDLKRIEGEDNELRYDISFASSEPYERWFGTEVLRIDDSMNLDLLNDNGAFLKDHNNAVDSVIGVVEKAYIEGEKARAVIRLDDTPETREIDRKIQSGILGKVSVGYSIDVMDDRGDEVDERGDPIFDCAITARECSLVAVPADATVGFGRSEEEERKYPFQVRYAERKASEPTKEVEPEKPEQRSINVVENDPQSTLRNHMTDKTEVQDNSSDQRVADMMALGTKYKDIGGIELAAEHLTNHRSLSDLQNTLMEKMNSKMNDPEFKKQKIAGKEIGLDKRTQVSSPSLGLS